MTLLHRAASIVSWIVRRGRAEQRLDDELRTFVEMSAAEKIRDGIAPDEARRLARLELGGLEQVKEHVRTRRHGHVLDEVARDLRYAFRVFTRTPGFTAVVLVTLALGIGANTAIFSLIDALMLRSLPVKNPHELVLVNLREQGPFGDGGESFSYPVVRALDAQRDIFVGAAGFTGVTFDSGTGGVFDRVPGSLVTGGYYETLGLVPAAGRLLTRDDDEPGAPLTAVISDGYWDRQYARSPSAIGRLVPLDGVLVTIVGVTPRGFTGTDVGVVADITIAMAAAPRVRPSLSEFTGPEVFWLRLLARPARGVSVKEAASRLNAWWPGFSDSVTVAHWSTARRKAMAESVFVLESGAAGWTYLREMYERPLFVLMAVAGLVLLIACANIASLFLARASTRHREIAVRLALGAGRQRVIRQLLVEGTLLSSTGAALGVGVAWVSGRFLVDLISSGPVRMVFDLTPNWHVLAFSSTLAAATGAVFGLAPAFQARHAGATLALTDDDRTSTRRSKLLPSLVTFQVALSLVLVAGAGLFARTLWNLQQVKPGFNADGVFVVELERGKGPAPDQLLEVVRHIPGVLSAGITTHTPLDGSSWTEAIVPAGQPMPEADNARIIAVGPQVLQSLQIPLVAGRDVTERDVNGAPAVGLINERYAERFFPKQNPVGQHLASSLMGQSADLEIVGVVKNTSADDLRSVAPPIVYASYAQFGGKLRPNLVIRAAGTSAGAAEAIRKMLQAQLPGSPVDVHRLSAQVNSTTVQERMMATLAGGFGLLALVISSVGLYGLLAYSVAQRSKEIGIRMALGAAASGVVRLVLLQGARLVGIGLLLGFPAAWAASRSVESMLFGLKPSDPIAMTAATALLVGAALLASYLPARRAARVDPLSALRHE